MLKGGKEARRSNKIIHKVITDALEPDVDRSLISLVEGRESVPELLQLDQYIDLVIPRGSSNLVLNISILN